MDTENSTKRLSCIRVHFRIAHRLELRMEEKQFSGETEDAIATVQAIIPEIEIPKIIISESMDSENSIKRV